MKHPALTRVMAIVLAILCLVMLLAGLLGLRSADRERQRALADAQRLRERSEAYVQIREKLKFGAPYEAGNRRLERKQKAHDERAAKHRMELAAYTAAQGGIRTGALALDQADAAFAEGKKQYEAGLAEFNSQAAAFEQQYQLFQQSKGQFQSIEQLYGAAAGILQSAVGYAQSARSMGALLESDDPEARRELTITAFDALLSAADQAAQMQATAHELVPALDTLAAMDAADLGQVTAFGGIDGVEIDPEQILQIKQSFDAAWPQVRSLITQTDELLPQIDAAVSASSGKSLAELRAEAQAQRDAVAAGDAETPIDDEQFAVLQAIYAQTSDGIRALLDAADGVLAQLQSNAGQIGAFIDGVRAQIAQADSMLEQGRAGIEQGRAALAEAGAQIEAGGKELYNARAMLWLEMGKQRDKLEELEKEKAALDREAALLKKIRDKVEARRELEQEERSIRLTLLKSDELRAAAEGGTPLAEAAAACADRIESGARLAAQGRFRACWLLVAAAVCGWLAIPAAFEQIRSRFLLIAPLLLCLAAAVGAEYLCVRIGRGSSYSALAGAFFALLQLLTVLPKKKT